MKPIVLFLVGPTASGKTDVALSLAARFPIDIVSADSLQLFRHMDIGTAKPPKFVREQIPHYLVDVLNPDEEATAAWFSGEARRCFVEIAARKRIPLVVGGAGFYLRAVEKPPVAPAFPFENRDIEPNYEELKKLDPELAAKIHPNDRYRISRALSLLMLGESPSEKWKASAEQEIPFESVWFGVQHDRKTLYDRINERMVDMFSKGLVEETEYLRKQFPTAQRRLGRSIGYRQSLDYLDGKVSKEGAVEQAATESRQYAKRQTTWFRRNERISWLPLGEIEGRMAAALNQIQVQ